MRPQIFVVAAVCTAFAATAAFAQPRGNPQDQLNRAADAVLKLKSAQFTLTREGAPAVLDDKNGTTFTGAQCLYAAPDRVSCNIKIASKSGIILQLTRVWVPEGAFQSNPLTRQFMKAPADAAFNGAVLFAKTGIPDVLRTSVQKVQIVGTEKIRDKNALHIRGEAKGEKLNPLTGGTLTNEASYPVELWMEDQTANPLRIHVSESGGNGWMVDLFAFNEPVDVPTPQLPPAPPAR
jgi:LppX/LprAFG-like lipoprotein